MPIFETCFFAPDHCQLLMPELILVRSVNLTYRSEEALSQHGPDVVVLPEEEEQISTM